LFANDGHPIPPNFTMLAELNDFALFAEHGARSVLRALARVCHGQRVDAYLP
jgi:hypothetical protein